MTKHYKNISVLIIDDDLISIKLLENKLNKLNINNIYSANNGIEGLELIQKRDKQIDIIFLDINMPEMDGIELLRHLVNQHFMGGIIIISGEEDGIISMVKGLSEVHQLNCLGTLQKAKHFKDLEAIIKIFINQYVKPNKNKIRSLKPEEILRGIQKGELVNFYQPKISLRSEQIIGCETLVRWQHPKLGLIPPNDFIPILINSNQSLALTKVIISQSLRELSNLLAINPVFTLSMNITMQDLNWLDLPIYVAEQAAEFNIDPKQVIFELTETELLNNLTSALEILAKLRLSGFNLSIDDFGTGFSNLEKLKLIKFDEIKIDRIFVHNAHLNPTAQAILKSCCLLGKSLDMVITAEGVETSEDKENLLALDVDQVQGYYFCKPLPLKSFIEYYEKHSKDRN
jgi:EAL domain-containing protein (putative c-di-GMP-specific phosphodiesterase class I)/FixJ family two-component response regulator